MLKIFYLVDIGIWRQSNFIFCYPIRRLETSTVVFGSNPVVLFLSGIIFMM